MVEVVTKAGRKFSGTPNHPMLTRRGWIALGDLVETDDLICYRSNVQEFGSSGNQHVKASPSTLRQVYDALSTVGVLIRKRSAKPDFHGDGMESYVDILYPFGVLPVGRFLPVDEFSIDGLLSEADVRTVTVATHRDVRSMFFLINQRHAFLKIAQFASSLRNGCSNASSVNPVLFNKLFHGYAGLIFGKNLFQGKFGPGMLVAARKKCSSRLRKTPTVLTGSTASSQHGVCSTVHDLSDSPITESRGGQSNSLFALLGSQRLSFSSPSYSSIFADGKHGGMTAADDCGDLGAAQSGQVELDCLLSLKWIHGWRGHVYNLTTKEGYFSANGIYTGNTTMLLNAGHQASRDQLQGMGIVKGKSWLTVGDNDVRPSHEDAEGQEVDNDEKFVVGDSEADFPGDPDLPVEERANCRCTVISLLTGEEDGPGEGAEEG
jgi:hypothetical protein